jgi:hypothetical protein
LFVIIHLIIFFIIGFQILIEVNIIFLRFRRLLNRFKCTRIKSILLQRRPYWIILILFSKIKFRNSRSLLAKSWRPDRTLVLFIKIKFWWPLCITLRIPRNRINRRLLSKSRWPNRILVLFIKIKFRRSLWNTLRISQIRISRSLLAKNRWPYRILVLFSKIKLWRLLLRIILGCSCYRILLRW